MNTARPLGCLEDCLDWVEKGRVFRVFAYGSLMWRPEIDYDHTQHVILKGWKRRYALYSYHYRGTEKNPGLVLNLLKGDTDDTCEGIVFIINDKKQAEIAAKKIWQREMLKGNPYKAAIINYQDPDGKEYEAVTFTASRGHKQFAGELPLMTTISIIKQASGKNGTNRDYAVRTALHLDELEIDDVYIKKIGEELTI